MVELFSKYLKWYYNYSIYEEKEKIIGLKKFERKWEGKMMK